MLQSKEIRGPAWLTATALVAALSGCSKAVVLNPAGDIAAQQGDLVILATVLMLIIIVPVILLTFFFAWKYRQSNTEAEYDPDFHHSTKLELIIWTAPGQLSPTYFDELAAAGWGASTYHDKQVVLAGDRKVHLLLDYSRDRPDGTQISRHHNLWIVTWQDGRWGIKQRSY